MPLSEIEQQLRFQSEVWSYAKQAPEAEEVVRRSFQHFRQACETMLEVGVAEGLVTTGDPRWAYLLLHALIDGLTVHLVLDPDLDLAQARAQVLKLMQGLLSEDGSP